MFVGKYPGRIVKTCTPYSVSSPWRASENAFSAALDAQYAPHDGEVIMLPMEEMLKM